MALKLSNRVKNPLLVLAILVILVSLVLIYGKNPGVNLPQKSAGETAQGVETPKENSAEAYSDFHNAYNNIPASYGDLENTKKLFDINDKIYGGIVSHHFLMAPEIAEFFAGFKDQRIETVVILGPNHFSRGEADIQISKYPYNTPWGVLEPNSEIIGKLLQNDFVSNEEATFNKEHSISTLAGFAKYFLPNAKIVPIVLKRKTTAMEAEKLAKALEDTLPDNAIVLASVDFSHHLNQEGASFHDTLSVSAIKSFDYDRLYRLEIDSPPTMYALLKYLENRGGQKMIYKNTNSAEFLNRPGAEDITSYVFGYFTKGPAEKENKISMLSFGNVMPGGLISQNKDSFEKIKATDGNFLRGTDLVSVNLEGAITDAENCQTKIGNIKFPTQTAKLLHQNGINLADLANGHNDDCFTEGKNDTQKNLDNFLVGYFGGDETGKDYIIKTIGDKRIAFVGVNETSKTINADDFYKLIRDLKTKNDYVIVNVSWENAQVGIAHGFVDNGADVVIGYEPHASGRVEVYKNKTILYSLGDFIPGQEAGKTEEGIGAGIILEDKKTNFFIFPFEISDGEPELLPYGKMQKFCDKFLGNIKTTQPCYFQTEP